MIKMKTKATKYHSLSRRIVAQFCLFTLFLSTIYGFFCFIFLYTLEDSFIEREIKQEADYLTSQMELTGNWPQTRSPQMTLHFSKNDLPDEIKDRFIAEPKRKEFYGEEGRHYHLYAISEAQQIYLVAEVSQSLLVRPIREGIIQFFLFFGIALTIFACFMAWRLGRKTIKPLKELAELVDGVAPENIPDSFADRFPKNEIGIVARSLEDSMRQISKALEREKCFTRDTSHELRTPVAIVKNAVEVYRAKNDVNEENHASEENYALVNRISDAALQMEQTVSTLLVLAREEHTSVEKEKVKLLSLVEQSIIDNGYLLNDKQVEVEVSDTCNVEVLAQKGMLKVLLDNLISNAFQYTELGEVHIEFIEDSLVVKDTGPGIDKDISNTVTEPAVKGSQSTGYGFGLSIVKRLCEHQGWQLSVESNGGTTISVAFS